MYCKPASSFREHEVYSSDRRHGRAAFSTLADQTRGSRETEWGGRGRGRRHEFLDLLNGLGVARPCAPSGVQSGSSVTALGLNVTQTVGRGGRRSSSRGYWSRDELAAGASRHVHISKALTKILRHKAVKWNIPIGKMATARLRKSASTPRLRPSARQRRR